jgi:hypothetical protein
MRITSWTSGVALVLGAGLLASGCASQGNTTQDRMDSNGTQLTGSYMPQSVERNGPVTNGKNNVRVIDRSDLEGSGGADVEQSLRQLGVTH